MKKAIVILVVLVAMTLMLSSCDSNEQNIKLKLDTTQLYELELDTTQLYELEEHLGDIKSALSEAQGYAYMMDDVMLILDDVLPGSDDLSDLNRYISMLQKQLDNAESAYKNAWAMVHKKK